MDYKKVKKVGVVIRELLTSFEVTNDEWKTIEEQIKELYLKESEKVILSKNQNEIYQSDIITMSDNI